MKKRVNLFSKKKQQQPIPTIAFAIRSYGLLFMCICIFLSIIAGVWYYFQAQKLDALTRDVDRLNSQMKANDAIQGNIVFFANKKEQLKTFLKDDARFELYYYLLNDAIKKSGTGATLVSFSLNLNRDTTFVVGFSDFSNSKQLLDYIETEEFLSNFDSLSLSQFAINPSLITQTDATNFQLSFQGILKKNETTDETN